MIICQLTAIYYYLAALLVSRRRILANIPSSLRSEEKQPGLEIPGRSVLQFMLGAASMYLASSARMFDRSFFSSDRAKKAEVVIFWPGAVV
jgi:hypothetical protein